MNLHTKSYPATAAIVALFLVWCSTPFGITHDHTSPFALAPADTYSAHVPIGGHGAEIDCEMLFVAPTSVETKQPASNVSVAPVPHAAPRHSARPSMMTAASDQTISPAVSSSLFAQAISLRI